MRSLSIQSGPTISTDHYLGALRPSERTWGNGLITRHSYDPEGMLFDITHRNEGSVAAFRYQWDQAHYRKEETKGHLNATDTFGYDGAHRITTSTVHLGAGTPSSRQYGYDAADNRISATNGTLQKNLTVGPEDRYQTEGAEQFAYDANGNLTLYSDGFLQKSYKYDYLNRLMEAAVSQGGQTTTLRFKYDPLGRRISKQKGGEITRYVYSGQQVLAELDESNAIQREYFWSDGTDNLMAIRQNGQIYFVHQNSLGSVAAITDQSGSVVERYDYDVFGTPTITDGTGTVIAASFLGQPYSFQGRELDSELGLFYYRMRTYDPQLGRFLQQDPEPFVNTPNLYAGFLNSPANAKDPQGNIAGVDNLIGGGLSVLIGAATTCAFGKCSDYTWSDVAVDFGVGFLTSGISGIKNLGFAGRMMLEVSVDLAGEVARREMKGEDYDPGDLLLGAARNFVAGEIASGVARKVGGAISQKLARRGADALEDSVEQIESSAARNLDTGHGLLPDNCLLNCFVSGTEVMTENGITTVEKIAEGDSILSLDSLTGQMLPRKVTQIFQRQTDSVIAITVGSEVIEVTDEHPFWVVGRGWVEAGLLQPGDRLLSASSAELAIISVEVRHGAFTVFNFEVDNLHNYYVSKERVLVHNCENLFDFKTVEELYASGAHPKWIHDRYVEWVRPGATERVIETGWSTRSGLGTRKYDDYDPITMTGFEGNTTPWSEVSKANLKRKLDQARTDYWIAKSGHEKVKRIIWFGTEDLPTSGPASEIREILESAGIPYWVVRPLGRR